MLPLLVLAIVAGGCGSDASGEEGSSANSTEWTGQVRVEPAKVGPLEISVGEFSKPQSARPGGSTIHHDLIYENSGSQSISFENQRSSTFVGGGPGLLVADDGCGYAFDGPEDPVVAGSCHADLDLIDLEPGEAESRRVSLFRDLRGMDQLEPGDYFFEHPVSFTVSGDDYSALLRLRYAVNAGA